MVKVYNVNGVEKTMTAEEEAAWETQIAQEIEAGKKRDEKIKAQEDLKASAKAKLIAGEPLTEDEANTIVL